MRITSTITVIRYLWAALAAVPTALALIGKIRAAFGNEQVKEVIKAFGEFIDKIALPAPTAKEPTGERGTQHAPAIPEQEKRRRLFRFWNRIKVAESLTDAEAHELCARHYNQSVDRQRA